MVDRQPRAGRVGMDGGRRDREDARAFTAAHHAVVGLAAPQRRHALKEDQTVQADLGRAIRGLEPLPRLSEKVEGLPRFALEIQERRSHQAKLKLLELGFVRIRERMIDEVQIAASFAAPAFGDFFQGRAGTPSLQPRPDRGEASGIHCFSRKIGERTAVVRRLLCAWVLRIGEGRRGRLCPPRNPTRIESRFCIQNEQKHHCGHRD